MDPKTIEKRFLRINIRLGLMTGVWPDQDETTKKLCRMAIFVLMLICYFTQYARLIVCQSVNVAMEDYPYLLATFGTTLKLGNYSINDAKIRKLLRGIYSDWSLLHLKDEIEIMSTYSRRGFLIALLYLLHVGGCITLVIGIPLTQPLMDVIKPLNESRRKLYMYPGYYFVDADKFYFLIAAHMALNVVICASVYCACDANYVYAIQHACGLLAVSGHRFKHACDNCGEGDEWNAKGLAKLTYEKVGNSVKIHQRALEYVKEIENAHDTCLFISVGMLMLSISLLLLRASKEEHDAQWLTDLSLLMTQLLHMLFLTAQGQFLMNSYEDTYNTIWEGLWYNSKCEVQALYSFALRRGLNPPLLTAGGFVTLNLKTFAEIIKASVSYYTVMQAT